MDRRTFIGTLAGSLLVAPLAAETQQAGKVYRIGILTNALPSAPEVSRDWGAFQQGLGEHGWVEGKNLVIEYRWADGQIDRFPSLAAELVSLKPDLILAVSTPAARAAKQATGTIPIVMIYVLDPIGVGLVASLARPGGNITGLTFTVGAEIVGKQLELLKDLLPKISQVAVLLNPDSSSWHILLTELQAAAQKLSVKLQLSEVRNPDELEGAFAAMIKERAGALLVLPQPFNFAHGRRIADLAANSRLPTAYPFTESVLVGGLMAYAANAPDMYRRAATYIDKILRGAKPADLPIEQPTKFELVINLKTARALGLTIPQSLLLRADEVIE